MKIILVWLLLFLGIDSPIEPVTTPISVDPVFEFSASECQSLTDFQDANSLEKNWLDDQTLQIATLVVINCCNQIGTGDFEIVDSQLLLAYQNNGENMCNCICGHELIFRFGNLDRKDYLIELKEVRN